MRLLSSYLLAALLVPPATFGASPVDPVNKDRQSIAIRGFDPVAYFTKGKPERGQPSITWQWMGATWQFASEQTREEFKKNPSQYAPQYGGYCSMAVSRGYTAEVDPEAWKIVDGKLYLNYNKGVQKKWESDVTANIEKANKNWPGLHK